MMSENYKDYIHRCGCGGDAYAHLIGNSDAKGYYICCEECGTKTAIFETLTEAAKAWEKAFAKDINVPTKERTARVKEGWGFAVCECGRRVFPLEKYCSNCGAKLDCGKE